MLKSISQTSMRRIEKRLRYLYGDQAPQLINRLFHMVGRYGVGINGVLPEREADWSERDAVLITYGNMVQRDGEKPLATLADFMRRRLKDEISVVHLLPFFPYSSDDGFSVIDYRVVDPALGDWHDVRRIGQDFDLMYDLVLNHVSRHSAWFKNYVSGIAPFRDFFIEVEDGVDLSQVVRPRNLPLLTETATRDGIRNVWTTFSSDQVDLDFSNPEVLFEFLDILFWYLSQRVRILRMDAIAYLWKIVGTSCIHLPETHEIVKIFRDIVDMVAPHTIVLTETNVPHEENVRYIGDGDEAHMVYQFTLPPLLAHSLLTGDAERLTRWAAALPDLPAGSTFLNFTASHDGVGVRPLQGLLSDEEFQRLLTHVEAVGGRISYKQNSDGSESPYELNVTYYDLLAQPSEKSQKGHVARFLSSQAIMLALRGVPAIYFNSLFGARNDIDGANLSGRHRIINRQKWAVQTLDQLLDDKRNTHHKVFTAYQHLLRVRREQPAFHPDAPQRILDLGSQVFALERHALDNSQTMRSYTNVTGKPVTVAHEGTTANDLIAQKSVSIQDGTLTLGRWQTVWLTNPSR